MCTIKAIVGLWLMACDNNFIEIIPGTNCLMPVAKLGNNFIDMRISNVYHKSCCGTPQLHED